MDKDIYQATVNGQHSFDITAADIANLDMIALQKRKFHLLQNGTSYHIEILEMNINEKTVTLVINDKRMEVALKDHYDRLVDKMGLAVGASQKVNVVKAPMPGLVLDINVKEGQTVEKGDALLILEAMKMENVIKAPNDALIQRIHIQKTDAVEKGALLIELE